MLSGRKVQAHTANEVASLFLRQTLVQEKKQVKLLRDRAALATEAPLPGNSARDSSLHERCMCTMLSYAQGTWLSRMMKRDRQSTRTVSYGGRVVGTWKYLGSGKTDPYARLEFCLEAAFMQSFVQGKLIEAQPRSTKKPSVRLAAQLSLPL